MQNIPSPPRAYFGYEQIKRYWDHHYNSYVAKILPGEFYVTAHDEIIMTLVGSCVSACIRDTVKGIGGMNHFMLPTGTLDQKWGHTNVSAASRYGCFAMENMINDILKHGGRREHLEVKLFGGGNVMANITSIGKQNIEFVREYVQIERLNLIAEDLGDIYPRKILYFPKTGRVRVKKLHAPEQTIIAREQAYQQHLEQQPVSGGDIELFDSD